MDPERPSKNRDEINALIVRLHRAQRITTERIQQAVEVEHLGDQVSDGFTVIDVLRMWVWHFWSHHRDLVRARGDIEGDNPHFHVPHFVRQANEEFGRFVGELACLSDEYLDVRPKAGERTVRETVEHVLESLEGYFADQVERSDPE